jgi:hypothetical protein
VAAATTAITEMIKRVRERGNRLSPAEAV